MTNESQNVLLSILNERLELLHQLDAEGDSERRRHIARETAELHAPLAHRLGYYAIKTELEDLSLKFTDYDTYKYIAHALAQKRVEREEYIARFIAILSKKLDAMGLRYTIKGRPKSIHSIWHKMQAQHCDVDKIYDLFAIRIILDSPRETEKPDCWRVYGMITDMYMPNPKRMRDWLSVPKENGYESLHATILGPDDRWVEVQIRSKRMDENAEHGTASHFSYKGIDGRIISEEEEYVFVYTPKGDLRKYVQGATILDFAFSIHTDVGHHCSGGLVNGINVPIRYKLQNGDKVEIQTSPNQHPVPSWLMAVHSRKAKTKIRQYLRSLEPEETPKPEANEEHKPLIRRRYDEPMAPRQVSPMEIIVDLNAKVDLNLASCCNPQPGEPIFGFITLLKGIRIHSCNCPNAENMRSRYPYRVLPARWK